MIYAKLFRSRWAAALWAAGILWTAVDVAGLAAPDTPGNGVDANATALNEDVTGAAIDNTDLANLAGMLNGTSSMSNGI